MAKLSTHGAEVGRVKFTGYVKAYMSDGAILKNYGDGWKLTGKVKPHVTPQTAYEMQIQKQVEVDAKNPFRKDYRDLLYSLGGVGKSAKLHLAVTLMPDDPDGVWSEVCDGYGDNVHADLDEICELCNLYRLACAAQP
jgi:hypothetical protein